MKRIFAAILIMALALPASAQSLSYEAVRVADLILSDSAWQPIEAMMSQAYAEDRQKAKASGKASKADFVFNEEMRRSFTRENFAKSFAQELTKNFTKDELKQLDAFFRSPVGQKYLNLNKSMLADPLVLKPIFEEACDAASRQLSTKEYAEISECKF